MSGLLCSDCHIDKSKEFIEKQEAEENAPDYCAICHKEIRIDEDRNKPKWQWEMDSGLLVCKACYSKKDLDYNKKVNYCSSCNAKLGMFFYHPKPAWKLEGNLCRRCWDRRNSGA